MIPEAETLDRQLRDNSLTSGDSGVVNTSDSAAGEDCSLANRRLDSRYGTTFSSETGLAKLDRWIPTHPVRGREPQKGKITRGKAKYCDSRKRYGFPLLKWRHWIYVTVSSLVLMSTEARKAGPCSIIVLER